MSATDHNYTLSIHLGETPDRVLLDEALFLLNLVATREEERHGKGSAEAERVLLVFDDLARVIDERRAAEVSA